MESVSATSGATARDWSSAASGGASAVLVVGPYYGARVINDAVETVRGAQRVAADTGLGRNVDVFA
ncbi:MAG: hypothetical protein H7338_03305 [Candidatus Sericytochromatia bacterium]|nr:hypothetical protein [Candidatus Sericytochromatia bacterium]